MTRLASRQKRAPLRKTLKSYIDALAKSKEEHLKDIKRLARKNKNVQTLVVAQVASLLDIKALRGQYALLKNASGDGIRTELVAFLQLCAEMSQAAIRVKAHLEGSHEKSKCREIWKS